MSTTTALVKATVERDQALDVIKHLLEGMTLKGACDLVGMTTIAFGRTVSEFPDLLIQMNKVHVSKVSQMMENIYGESEKNLRTLTDECARLRLRLEIDDPMIDRKDTLDMLLKIDKYIQGVITKLTPVLKDVPEKPNHDDDSAIDASRILSEMQGANLQKVVMTVSVERHHAVDDDGDVIDGIAQTPIESQVQDADLHHPPYMSEDNELKSLPLTGEQSV